ncbi:hypothetical protein IJ670_06345 [bacterium]|nr:hypothetical protein [bacterium]
MKRLLILCAIFVLTNACYGAKQVTSKEYNATMRASGIAEMTVKRLDKIEKEYQNETKKATDEANKYCEQYKCTQERLNSLLETKKYRSEVHYEMALKSLLNKDQIDKYKEIRHKICRDFECSND